MLKVTTTNSKGQIIMANKLGCIILAAGKGSRMKSNIPKPLHKVAGLSMIGHMLKNVKALNPEKIVVVISNDMPEMAAEVKPHAEIAIQEVQNGTGGAVLAAKEHFKDFDGDIIVMFGDSPLLTTDAMQSMVDARRECPSTGLSFSYTKPNDPKQYGRMVLDENGFLLKIVEFADATDEEKKIDLCNGDMMCADGSRLFEWQEQIDNNNKQNEYYMVDLPIIARKHNFVTRVVEIPVEKMSAANSRNELALLENTMQQRLRAQHMTNGATLIDPNTVYFCHDTVVGRDVVIEPNVFFGENVTVADNVLIKSSSHIVGAEIGEGAEIGPFARIRPGTKIGAKSKVCNFVEMKNSTIGNNTDVKHLTYIGDTTIGNNTNIGAGTIVCNYDGFQKHPTNIGNNVFVGANSTLLSPVNIEDEAMVGAGSVINLDVEAEALAITRADTRIISKWGKRFRERKQKEKDAKK